MSNGGQHRETQQFLDSITVKENVCPAAEVNMLVGASGAEMGRQRV